VYEAEAAPFRAAMDALSATEGESVVAVLIAAAERDRIARLLEDRAARAVPGVERDAWAEAAVLAREEAGRADA
jgi:hypothetical protein